MVGASALDIGNVIGNSVGDGVSYGDYLLLMILGSLGV